MRSDTLPLQAPSFPLKRVRADLKKLFFKLSEAAAQGGLVMSGETGAVGGVIGAIFGAAETVTIERPVGELAWRLVCNGIARAIADVLQFDNPRREPLVVYEGGQAHLTRQLKIRLDADAAEIQREFFQHPLSLNVYPNVRRTLESWLRLLGLNPNEAQALASRLDGYFPYALHQEWRDGQAVYQPVLDYFETPFAHNVQLSADWERNRHALIRAIDEPVFEEAFSLRSVYVGLRAYWLEQREREQGERRGPNRLYVFDLHKMVTDWLANGDRGDAIRLISGGPGSGKTSFAKKLAADLAEEGRSRVLYFPLQRFPPRLSLDQAIRKVLVDSGTFAADPLDPRSFVNQVHPLLLVFDGLDELTKPGDLADQMTTDFVREVRTSVAIWNSTERRVLVLVTGRTVISQRYRQALGLTAQQQLTVLPYLPDELSDLAQRNNAKLDPFLDEQDLWQDQREIWWRKYTEKKGLKQTLLPRIFNANVYIKRLSAEPLLNYLIVRGRFHEPNTPEPRSRNQIYARLMGDVLNRRHARRFQGEQVALAAFEEVADREVFERLLETIAIAAWRGDGRTATLEEVRGACPSDLKDTLDRLVREPGGMHRLVAAFYVQESQDRSTGNEAFEFTHKSFGEYLTVRRLIREIKRIELGLRTSRAYYDERTALAEWAELCVVGRISIELLSFLRDECLLQDKEDVGRWQRRLASLFSLELRDGFPTEALKGATFRELEQRSRNAEEALFVSLNACARATSELTAVGWRSPEAASEMLNRLRSQRLVPYPSLILASFSHISLDGQDLNHQHMTGASLENATLRHANLSSANLAEVHLEDSCLDTANLSDANLRRAQLQRTVLTGAICRDVDLSESNLFKCTATGMKGHNLKACGCFLLESDFRHATLSNAKFNNAIMDGCIFGWN